MNYFNLIYVICFIMISVAYMVSVSAIRRRCERRTDFEVKYMSDRYAEIREKWIRKIEALKEENDSLKVDNTVLQADNVTLKEQRDEIAVKLCEAVMWCEVGTPCDNSRVLVCSVTTKGEKRINIAYYEDGSWHGNGNLDNVIAWKSLPEMPDNNDEK